MKLGVAQDDSDVYEGGGWLHAVYPPPILTPISLPATGNALVAPDLQFVIKMPLIFREDSFDPTSRIKRGRIYARDQGSQPQNCYVYPHPARQTEMRLQHSQAGLLNKMLVIFYPHQIAHEFGASKIESPIVILGTAQAYSLWRIIDIERLHNGEELITLRSARSMGSLPNLLTESLPPDYKAKIIQATETLASDIHRSAPESIVDRTGSLCAVAMAAYLSTKDLPAPTAELADLARKMETLPEADRRYVVANAARIIALLHARSKPSEQARRPIRKVMEQDAELAVACVGVVLCDLSWATWT